MPSTADRCKETSTTTGTGDFTLLGAVSKFQAFSAAFPIGVSVMYAIVGQTGTEWETGKGTLTAASTLRRDIVRDGSSGKGVLVNFTAGTKDVFATATAEHLDNASLGMQIALNMGWPIP